MANTTWSPTDKTAGITLSGGNLVAAASVGGNNVRTSDRQVTGKFYWEITFTTGTNVSGAGIANAQAAIASIYATPLLSCVVYSTGQVWLNNVNTGITLGTMNGGGIACHALDLTNGLFWVRNGAAGNWNNSGTANPVTGVGGINIGWMFGGGIPVHATAGFGGTGSTTANFGDTAFVGAVPSGFTSGFTAGATINTNALATQTAVEHWLSTNPNAQTTQVLVEHWATVANAVFVPSTDTRAMILA